MYIALDHEDKRINISNAKIGQEYFCPICKEKLSIKAKDSISVKAHFAHQKGTDCLDNWKHDMSEWHYSWQAMFPEECQEVVVEKDCIKHRADVLINNTVIEFQHSPITSEEIAQRNSFYLECGYEVIWVFDANGRIKNAIDSNWGIAPIRENSLVWKRVRSEFKQPMPNGVNVFVEYSINADSNPIMLLLSAVDSKIIRYKNPSDYFIKRQNFLKEFNVVFDDDIQSVSEIIELCEQEEYIYTYKQNKKESKLFIPLPRKRYKRYYR